MEIRSLQHQSEGCHGGAAGRGGCLSREGVFSLLGDSHSNLTTLQAWTCLLLPLIPLFSGQSQVFSSPMFLSHARQQKKTRPFEEQTFMSISKFRHQRRKNNPYKSCWVVCLSLVPSFLHLISEDTWCFLAPPVCRPQPRSGPLLPFFATRLFQMYLVQD